MKNNFLLLALSGLLIAAIAARAGTIYDTFETGEDTSNWGASWSSGIITNTFLSSSYGGLLAGAGSSAGQSFSRSFKNNTASIDLSQNYYISAYIQLDSFDVPSGGQFEFIDGDYGAHAADIKVALVGGNLVWQAQNNGTFQDIGLNMNLSTPYQILISVDPSSHSYSGIVNEVNADGVIQDMASFSGFGFDQNVVGNHQNGTLLYYIQGSAGTVDLRTDNITISSMPISTTATPEPSSIALAAGGLATILFLKKSRRALS